MGKWVRVGVKVNLKLGVDPRISVGAAVFGRSCRKRRSVRRFEDLPLTEAELGQLLWAGQGITDEAGHRTAPSAGALYPLELFVATEEGVFHYDPEAHQLIVLSTEDARTGLYEASQGSLLFDLRANATPASIGEPLIL